MPSSTISTSASPTDFSSTARNGGESICESALMAASSIFVLHCGRRRLSRRTQTRRAHRPQKICRQCRISMLDPRKHAKHPHTMSRLSRRSFLGRFRHAGGRAGIRRAAQAADPRAGARGRALGQRRRGDRRGRRRRHRRGAAPRRVRQALRAASRRPTRSADAASPTARRSACRTIAAPTGSTRADINPVAKLAPQTGLDLYPAPPGQRMRIGRRYAREGEMEDFLAGLVRANSAIADAARGSADVSCAQALPKDLGDWRPSIEFVLGPYGGGKDLAEVSAVDFAARRARQRRVLPPGVRRAARQARADPPCSSRRR